MSAPRDVAPLEPVRRVAICVATCRRPAGLKRLLESLDALEDPGPGFETSVIVVDNDPDRPAMTELGDVASHCRWPLTYAMEPVPGVVAARNALLSLVPEGTDFVAFIDDDETATPGWLAALLSTQAVTGATAVQGPVRPDFEITPPAWLNAIGLYELGPYRQGEPLAFASTNNALVCWSFVETHDLRFDGRFNRTGGEDEEFFTRLLERGGTIVASADALVIDRIPKNRMSVGWLMRRSHRMGNTLGRIAILHNRKKAERLAKGLAATLIGLVRLATAGLLIPRHRVAGAVELARGTGMLAAFLGMTFEEYSPAAVSSDRGEIA
jgi:succinoglycan biosynthesis protein ExoM